MHARARVARNVRRLRVEAGISQEMLAVDAKVQTAHLSRIERQLSNPTLDVLTRIANALDCYIAQLFAQPSSTSEAQNLRKGRKPRKASRR